MLRLEYFRATEGYFWQWEDQGEVIAIPKGNTIAYKALIQEALDALAPQGLPPLGSLLLALIATNPNQGNSLSNIEEIIGQKVGDAYPGLQKDLLKFFFILQNLPNTYKQGGRRIQVFQVLFERCHNILSLKDSQRIADGLSKGLVPIELLREKGEFRREIFVKDFRVISLLLKRFPDTESLLQKIASLPELEEPLLLPEHDRGEEEPVDFITELTQSPKTFPIGSLIKRIWSGIHLPVQRAAPSQQALGGVSDITNKGNFDQLLISEYAHDDLVFLQRLANNEALYIQREVPPASNIHQRIILVDISLKNWGTPKTIAFATMLAIANHPKASSECIAFAVGESWNPISIDSLEGIIEGLQFLEGSLHFGKGLDRFFTEYDLPAESEIILISEPSTLQYPELQRILAKYHKSINYWIHTDAQGHIDVYRKQQKTKRHLQHIALPLAELWEKKPKQKTKRKEDTHYPILFRNPSSVKRVIPTKDGEVFLITTEKSLLGIYDKSARRNQKGWQLILEKLPYVNGEVEIGVSEAGEHILLMFDQRGMEIHLWNLETGVKQKISFPHWKFVEAHNILFIEDAFYHVNNKGAWRISVEGEIIQVKVGDPTQHILRKSELARETKDFTSTSSTLKNIREIFLNEAGNLVFNIHQLRLAKDFHIAIKTCKLLERVVKADKVSDTEFLFREGSRIEINRTGMLKLESSDPEIPLIYVPSVLDTSLGVGTESHFAGNEYFYMDTPSKIKITVLGESSKSLSLYLSELLKINQAVMKRELHDLPYLLPETFSGRQFHLIISRLKNEEGVEFELLPADDKNATQKRLKKISTTEFYKKYIQAFIDQIVSHGT